MSRGPDPSPKKTAGDSKGAKKNSAKRKSRAGGGLGAGSIALALLRRPVLWGVGALLCALAILVDNALDPSSRGTVFNLMTYVPFLGGGWAVFATVQPNENEAGFLPGRPRMISFALAALVVIVVSGLARVTLTILGELVVKTALSLGPTVALAERSMPHKALWRGMVVIDEHPRDFLKVSALSLGILVLTVALVPFAVESVVSAPSMGNLVRGAARGLGWAIISAVWMRFYLRIRPGLGEP